MAKLRMRHRDPENKNVGITYVHGPKATELIKRKKIYKIVLVISVLLNIVLTYLHYK